MIEDGKRVLDGAEAQECGGNDPGYENGTGQRGSMVARGWPRGQPLAGVE